MQATSGRPITVGSELRIYFSGASQQTISRFASQFNGLCAEIREGNMIFIPSPVTDYSLSLQTITAIREAGGRFEGFIGRWINQAPDRARRMATQQTPHCNAGGFPYRMAAQP